MASTLRRGLRAFIPTSRAFGSHAPYTPPTPNWDTSSGFAPAASILTVMVGGIAGAAALFTVGPVLWKGETPHTFEPEHVKAQKLKEHAKNRVGAPGEPIGRNPFRNKLSPEDYLNPPASYRTEEE